MKCKANSPDHYKSSWIKTMYGIEDWMIIIKQQNYKCAICGNELDMAKNTHIDHDHETGKVRGILCHCCNMGIGFFKDDITRIEKALIYLNNN
jgi:DNA-directed RNA polymerase subunit RPC12/RpoP